MEDDMRVVPHKYCGTKNMISFMLRGRYQTNDPFDHYYVTTKYIEAVPNRLIAFPHVFGINGKITKIGINVHTGISGSSVRFGIYADDPKNEMSPSSLLYDSGDVSTATSGAKETSDFTVRFRMNKPLWFASIFSHNIIVYGFIGVVSYLATWMGYKLEGNIPQRINMIYADMTYGQLPSNFPTFSYGYPVSGSQQPLLFFKVE